MSSILYQITSPNDIRATVWEPSWPEQCGCCNGESETTARLHFKEQDSDGHVTYERSWLVPYCLHCEQHLKKASGFNGASQLSARLTLGVLLMLAASCVVCLYFHSVIPFVMAWLVIWIVMIGYKVNGVQQGRDMMKPSCCSTGLAVVCLSHHKYRGDMHTFSFKNKLYGQAFKNLNKAS